MADKFLIKVEKRESRGKNEARRMRAAGNIPVVIYGGGGEAIAATAALADLARVIRSDSGVNTVFSLDMGGETGDVIFQDRQVDPVRGRLMHADLRRLIKGEKIEMTVTIQLDGEPIGVKEDGGMLEQPLCEVKILVEPAKAPEAIHIDVSGLKLGESLHVSDLKVDTGIEIDAADDAVVAHVVSIKEPELEPQVAEGAEPVVEGVPPAEPEGE